MSASGVTSITLFEELEEAIVLLKSFSFKPEGTILKPLEAPSLCPVPWKGTKSFFGDLFLLLKVTMLFVLTEEESKQDTFDDKDSLLLLVLLLLKVTMLFRLTEVGFKWDTFDFAFDAVDPVLPFWDALPFKKLLMSEGDPLDSIMKKEANKEKKNENEL